MAAPRNKKGKNFDWRGGEYAMQVIENFEKNLDRTAIIMVSEIKASMKGSESKGTLSGASKGVRRSSAAGRYGQPPRVQTARLRNSIKHAKRGALRRVVGAGVGSAGGTTDSEKGYAYILEMLSHRKGYRPYMKPYIEKNKRKLHKGIAQKLPPMDVGVKAKK